MYVLTVDQRGSRTDADRVAGLLETMSRIHAVRPFERTAGDEVQAVLADPVVVVDIALQLVRQRCWSVGVGVGPVEQPLPASTRAGRGPAFEHARTAVGRAKAAATRVAVHGVHQERAAAAQAVLDLVALLVVRRSPAGWAAVQLVAAGATQVDAATQLGVSRQAVSQRIRATHWPQEQAGRRVVSALLSEADQ